MIWSFSPKGEKLRAIVKNSGKLNDEVDELYQLPLAEFTGARNALAARLKQSGRANDASLVKALQKPPVSAWAVNQLYWNSSRRVRFVTCGRQARSQSQSRRKSGGPARIARCASRSALAARRSRNFTAERGRSQSITRYDSPYHHDSRSGFGSGAECRWSNAGTFEPGR